MRDEENQYNDILYTEMNKPGRKGAISEVARRVGIHRNTVRRILQGTPGKGLNTSAVFLAAAEVVKELEQKEQDAKNVIQERIARHQQKIKSLRSQVAA